MTDEKKQLPRVLAGMEGKHGRVHEEQKSLTPGVWHTRPCSAGGVLLVRGDMLAHPQHMLQVVPEVDGRAMAGVPALLATTRTLIRALEGKRLNDGDRLLLVDAKRLIERLAP